MQGHIRKRGKHSWTLVINLGRDPVTGKRKQMWRTVEGSKRDAEAALAKLITERDSGIDIDPGRMTVGQYLERWLRDYSATRTAPKTHLTYSQIVRVHLIPSLGAVPLSKLRPQHIQAAYSRVIAGGRSERTALHCHRVLSEALRHAVKWQLLGRNPADAIDPPRPARREMTMPNAVALNGLLEFAEATPYGPLVNLALMTGMRLGELLGLRWQDVDLDRAELSIRQTAQWLPRVGVTYRSPKTAKSSRSVALSPSTIDRLRSHRQDQVQQRVLLGPAYRDSDLVFCTVVGLPLDPSNIRRAWKKITDGAGVKMRFHDLRHAHATLMLQLGIHPKIVSERLGHATIAITLDTYSHVLPGLQAEAAEKFDALFSDKALANG